MPPIDVIYEYVKKEFSNADIGIRRSDDMNGPQFLNISVNGILVDVEWKPGEGFGVSSTIEDFLEYEGFYSSSDEWYRSAEAAYHRIASLILDHISTRPIISNISKIRQERGISQIDLSQLLQVTQATYSKLERREDMKMSSLQRVVEGMGGKLHIQVVFEDTKSVREIILQR